MAFSPNNGIFNARPALGFGGFGNVDPIHAGWPWQWNGAAPLAGVSGLSPAQSNAMWTQPSFVGAPVNQPQAFGPSQFAFEGGHTGQFAGTQQPNRLAGFGRLGMFQRTMVR
jgi:hypothetical protein